MLMGGSKGDLPGGGWVGRGGEGRGDQLVKRSAARGGKPTYKGATAGRCLSAISSKGQTRGDMRMNLVQANGINLMPD